MRNSKLYLTPSPQKNTLWKRRENSLICLIDVEKKLSEFILIRLKIEISRTEKQAETKFNYRDTNRQQM